MAAVPAGEPVVRESGAHPVADDGTFEMAEVPPDPSFFVRSSRDPLWVLAEPHVPVARQDAVVLRLPRGYAEPVAVRGRVAGRAADTLDDAFLAVTQSGWTQSLPLEIHSGGTAFRSAPLPAGRYRLQLFGRTGRFPAKDLGEHEIDGYGPYDLGLLELQSGTLSYSFSLGDGGPIEQLVAWVEDRSGLLVPLPPGTSGRISLRPDRYELFASSR